MLPFYQVPRMREEREGCVVMWRRINWSRRTAKDAVCRCCACANMAAVANCTVFAPSRLRVRSSPSLNDRSSALETLGTAGSDYSMCLAPIGKAAA